MNPELASKVAQLENEILSLRDTYAVAKTLFQIYRGDGRDYWRNVEAHWGVVWGIFLEISDALSKIPQV